MKKVFKNLNKWREILPSLIEKPNIVKMSIIPKFFLKYLFIYFGCAGSQLQHVDSQLWHACGIQFPDQGSNPVPPCTGSTESYPLDHQGSASIIPKLIYQSPSRILCRYRQSDPEIYMEIQKTRIAKTILKKNKVGRVTLPDLKLFIQLQ